jgi:hypothetical protein
MVVNYVIPDGDKDLKIVTHGSYDEQEEVSVYNLEPLVEPVEEALINTIDMNGK